MELADLEDLMLEKWLRERNSGKIAWKTKDGKVIPIKDMSDKHLDNTIKMIKRKSDESWKDMEALGSIGDKFW